MTPRDPDSYCKKCSLDWKDCQCKENGSKEELKKNLRELEVYTKHNPGCPAAGMGKCNCGLEALKMKINKYWFTGKKPGV